VPIGLFAVLLLLLAASASVLWPLRTARQGGVRDHGERALELARDDKLGELHDLELDYRLGKLSPDDYQELNESLRTEAVEIIRRIDSPRANGTPPEGPAA
jgi:hypothetical protein